MATFTAQPMKPRGLGSVELENSGAKASETWARGAVLISDATGYLAEAGANPTSIVGVAMNAVSSATAGAVVQYVPALSSITFVGTLDDMSAEGTGVLAQTDVNVKYGITVNSDGVWIVDKNKTSDATVRVVVTGLVDAVGDVLGKVRFRFLQGVSDLGGTAVALTIYSGSV